MNDLADSLQQNCPLNEGPRIVVVAAAAVVEFFNLKKLCQTQSPQYKHTVMSCRFSTNISLYLNKGLANAETVRLPCAVSTSEKFTVQLCAPYFRHDVIQLS